jgi:hypothetical protein
LKRTSSLAVARPKRTPISPASRTQRIKVARAECIVCGQDSTQTTIDPAHVVPRSLCATGADHPDAVVPLCRVDHSAYDENRLDLLPFMEPRYRDELAYAVKQVGLSRTFQIVTGQKTWLRETA